MTTNLYSKPTDSHNYLCYSSSHLQMCKGSIPYSQYLTIHRICSKISDFDKHVKDMTIHFFNRGHPIDLLEEAAIKARRKDRDSLRHCRDKTDINNSDRSFLVTTYHPEDFNFKEIITKNWGTLGKRHTTLPIFNRNPMVAYCRPLN